MENDFIYKEMEELGADGVDFVPLIFNAGKPPNIYKSYNKKEWRIQSSYPKTNRKYWKIQNGKKFYIETTTNFNEIMSFGVDELTDFLDKYGDFDGAPWTNWFNGKYCSKCESIMCSYENSNIKFPVAWCELNDGKCKHFEDLEVAPDNKETIKMWLCTQQNHIL